MGPLKDGLKYGRFRRLIGAAGVLILSLASFSLPAYAADSALERGVKAAFLLNFTRFVDWPAGAFSSPAAPLTICILGKDPFEGTIDRIVEGESAHDRKVAVKRIDGIPETGSCQVVFAAEPARDLPQFLARVEPGVLTVGEGEDFLRAGGMIGFVLDHGRVRFRIQQRVAESNGLRLSSRLLSVAQAVEK